MIAIIGFVWFATSVTWLFGENQPLCHFSVIRNTRKLCTPSSDPYMQKVAFFDAFKFYFHTGSCIGHLVLYGAIVPHLFGK